LSKTFPKKADTRRRCKRSEQQIVRSANKA
jgi:hypothetical protein